MMAWTEACERRGINHRVQESGGELAWKLT